LCSQKELATSVASCVPAPFQLLRIKERPDPSKLLRELVVSALVHEVVLAVAGQHIGLEQLREALPAAVQLDGSSHQVEVPHKSKGA
jgi:hypothetical protein